MNQRTFVLPVRPSARFAALLVAVALVLGLVATRRRAGRSRSGQRGLDLGVSSTSLPAGGDLHGHRHRRRLPRAAARARGRRVRWRLRVLRLGRRRRVGAERPQLEQQQRRVRVHLLVPRRRRRRRHARRRQRSRPPRVVHRGRPLGRRRRRSTWTTTATGRRRSPSEGSTYTFTDPATGQPKTVDCQRRSAACSRSVRTASPARPTNGSSRSASPAPPRSRRRPAPSARVAR